MMLKKFALFSAAALVSSSAGMAAEPQITDAQIAHIAYTAGQLDVDTAKLALERSKELLERSSDAAVQREARATLASAAQEFGQFLIEELDIARSENPDAVKELEEEAANVFRAIDVSPEGVALELAVEDVSLAVGKAIPCGLILNELITNALRHAFPDGRTGMIRVELAPVDSGGLRLAVRDDGVGLPVGLDFETSPSLGLQLVRMLSKQLGAALEVRSDGGTCVRLTVPPEAS